MSKENPKIIPQEIKQVETLEKKEHEIILFNDDVNTFEHVIECLVRICGHSHIQAEQCAFITILFPSILSTTPSFSPRLLFGTITLGFV